MSPCRSPIYRATGTVPFLTMLLKMGGCLTTLPTMTLFLHRTMSGLHHGISLVRRWLDHSMLRLALLCLSPAGVRDRYGQKCSTVVLSKACTRTCVSQSRGGRLTTRAVLYVLVTRIAAGRALHERIGLWDAFGHGWTEQRAVRRRLCILQQRSLWRARRPLLSGGRLGDIWRASRDRQSSSKVSVGELDRESLVPLLVSIALITKYKYTQHAHKPYSSSC